MIHIRGRSVRLLGLAVLAILIAPCLIEIGLRIAACRTQMAVPVHQSGVETVPSWTTYHQLVPLQRKRLQGRSVPADGTVNAPPVTPVAFRTNSLGLRGREVTTPGDPGGFRILCLGDDSFLGSHTHETRTVPARLEYWLQQRSRTRIEVINAALPDSCPLLSFLQMQHGLLALQPDLIIVDVNLRNAASDRRCRRFTELAADGRPLVCSHPQLAAPKRSRSLSENFLVVRHTEQMISEWLCGTRHQPAGRNNLTAIPAAYTGNTLAISDEQLSLTLSPLLDLSRLAHTVPARLIVSSHPTHLELLQKTETTQTPFPQRVGEFARAGGILFNDSTSAFRAAAGTERLFLSNGEFSMRGHETYARELAVAITELISSSARSLPPDTTPQTHPPAQAQAQHNRIQPTAGTESAASRFTRETGRESETPAADRKTRLAPFSVQR